MTYTTPKKTQINEYMQSTNYYLLNEFPVPEGVVMYGGKTGTTSMAKSCLILMTKNKKESVSFCSTWSRNKRYAVLIYVTVVRKLPN